MKTPFLTPISKLSLALAVGLSAIYSASAATEHWLGAGADSNWTTSANWSSPQQSYYNDVDFTDYGGNTSLGVFSVDNICNASTGVAQMPIYQLRMYPTNRNFTTLINPGVKLYTGAGAGDLYVGADTITAARGTPNIQETITFTGAGGTLALNGTLHVGQGLGTSATNTVPPSTQYVTLNMSGLDNFIMMTNYNGGNASTGSTAASRFLLCGQIQHYSQGAIYLAKTNNIQLGNDMEIGAMSVYSNSLPCPLYLGMQNSILVGCAGAANGLVTVGSRGNTNASLTFNPAFLGGATPPTATFASPASVNGGLVNTFYVCLATGGVIPAYAYADFTGGSVSIMTSTLQLGTAGTNGVGALGVLTADNGIINANNVLVGDQTVSFASSGAVGVGIINLNTNSTYGTNATLLVNNTLTLGAVTGTPNAGTAGTININGGVLVASTITNGGAGSTVNITNGTWGGVATVSLGVTNMTVTTFNAGGVTNLINITAITPFLGGSYPVRFHLISAQNMTGASTLGIASLPASFDPSHLYAGYLDYTNTPGLVDFVLTAGPSSARSLTWSGLNAGSPDGNWDVGQTIDWLTNGVPTTFNQLDQVTFNDVFSPAQTNITLTTMLTPYSITVSNVASLYTISGSGGLGTGEIGGTPGLIKQGTGTLILDNASPNTFTGGITISGGMLQVGTNDTGGSLPSGVSIVNNSVLAFDRTDNVIVGNVISGAGTVVSAGGSTLQLDAANTFTGNALATNSSTLQGGLAGSFGTGGGTVIIANGSTFDPNGAGTTKAVTVSGTGVNGNGAIVNSGGAIYDSSGGLTPTLTLTGNTTLSYPTRWDLGGSGSTTATLSTGGNPYNLTLNSTAGYHEWRNVVCDTKLGDIYLAAGTLGYVGSTSAGNPTNSLVISNGTVLQFYAGTVNVTVNKQVVLQDGGTLENSSGTNTISGPMVITNVNNTQYCTFNIGGTSLTLSSNVSGNGLLYLEGGNGTLIVNGNGSAFTGGVAAYQGTLVLNGIIGSGITNQSGNVLEGAGTNSGTMDVSGALTPGTAVTAGTLTVGGLVLEGSALLTNNLTSATTVGQGVNSFIQVNGNLTLNNNTIHINPLAPLANNSTYTLLACTGTVTGAFAGAATVQASQYTLTLNQVTTSSNTLIQLTVTGGTPSLLVWNNAAGNSEWDVDQSQNWSNVTTHAAADYFYAFDPVVLNDSITSSANPSTSIDIASGVIVIPAVMTNSSTTNNYAISGAGKISGSASIVKLGSSTLTINTTNDFTGSVVIAGGTLLTGPNASLGGSSGTVYVTNGATLDLGYSLGSKPLVISGAGVNGAGALVNSIGSPIYDSPGGLVNITLETNATIGGSNRVDFGQISPASGVLNSGGSNYSLTVVGTAYREWDNVTFDANFGNINVMTTNGGAVGIKGLTTLGNATNTLAVFSNAIVELYEDSGNTANNVILNKKVLLYGGSAFESGGGTNVILSPMTLGIASGDNCTNNIAGVSLTVSNVISGPGNLIKIGSSPLILAGANTYTGSTVVTTGPLNLIGTGSISGSANISLASGQVLSVSGRTDQTLTLASGQTLQGTGTVNGALQATSGSTVAPGVNGTGTLTVTNNVVLGGATTMGVGVGSNNVLSGLLITYGGTLNLSFVPGSLAAGNSFTLFKTSPAANNFAGSFASITPATPGPGLAWNTSQLATSGILTVTNAKISFGSFLVAGTNLTLTGTGGTPSGPYYILASTNVLGPWMTNGTGAFDASGNFAFTNGINTNNASLFYILGAP